MSFEYIWDAIINHFDLKLFKMLLGEIRYLKAVGRHLAFSALKSEIFYLQ